MFTLSRDEVRELDRRAIEEFGVPGVVLMENAGRGCAELLMRLNPTRKPVVILCGPGNNGGDGFVIARHLDNAGWPVKIGFVVPQRATGPQGQIRLDSWHPIGFPPDANTNYQIVAKSRLECIPIHDVNHAHGALNWFTEEAVNRECWIVDALFGTGLSRALTAPSDELVAMMNASRNPVLAIDIPSGLACDTGEPLGPTVRAAHTATFVAHKRGFLNPKAKEWTGEVHVIDIGAPRALVDEYRRGERGA